MSFKFLCALLLIFAFLTPFYNYGEIAIIEIIQSLTLLTSIFVHLSCKKYFLKLSNVYVFITRLFLLLFLFYEEVSFLTRYFIKIPQIINLQEEINIHNLSFFNQVLFRIPVPFTDHLASISLLFLSIYIFSVLIGCGLFLPYLKRFRYLFWEKQYAIFSFVILVNFLLSSMIREIFSFYEHSIIHIEYIELFMYVVFLLDVIQKRKIMKKLFNIKKVNK